MSMKDHLGAIGVKPWLAHSRKMDADVGWQFVNDGPKGGKTQNHFGTSATVGLDQGLLGAVVAQVPAAYSCRYLEACRFRPRLYYPFSCVRTAFFFVENICQDRTYSQQGHRSRLVILTLNNAST